MERSSILTIIVNILVVNSITVLQYVTIEGN